MSKKAEPERRVVMVQDRKWAVDGVWGHDGERYCVAPPELPEDDPVVFNRVFAVNTIVVLERFDPKLRRVYEWRLVDEEE
jgi:hypothetical protein